MSALADQAPGAAAEAPVPTPCIGVCELDADSGLCRGCARTGEEIGDWQNASNEEKARIWDAIGRRRAEWPMACYRLPWPSAQIGAMIERSLQRRWGRWELGIPGASVSFSVAPGDDAEILSGPAFVTAVTPRGALRLVKHEKTIAVAFGDQGDGCGPAAIGLVLPRGRVDMQHADRVTSAGADENAVCVSRRKLELFDLGLGSGPAARFCLRTDNASAGAALVTLERGEWPAAGPDAAWFTGTGRLDAVVETGLGRAEIFDMSTDGLATALSPIAAQLGESPRELPEGWELKPVFAPCALFYPSRRRCASAFVHGPF